MSVTQGELITLESFPSKFINKRTIRIWLPDNYRALQAAGVRFDVIYMQDGQMLFDELSTWNNQEWGVDETAHQLMKESQTAPFIVVGIDNGGHHLRHAEYFPQAPFEQLSTENRQRVYQAKRDEHNPFFQAKIQSDHYLQFLVDELKPYIDREYATQPTLEHTFIMGSSMGALISIYALTKYPDVFGGAACLSTHWPGVHTMSNNPVPQAFIDYFAQHLPQAGRHKIYFDHGTEGVDALYSPTQKAIDKIMQNKGYKIGHNWHSSVFAKADHSEKDWRARLPIPLRFLLNRK